jgi:alanyl-tRNA synthetase
MTSNEIRSSFLQYFERYRHRIVPSSPLVPADDPTLLFTNAGMNQFKDVFLGREKRSYTRATTSQKCMRVSGKHNDLDNVGPSLRHHTFFEMLGNFSFGDYFKDEAIELAWRLLTEVWKMPPERLVVSIFKGDRNIPRDEEAYEIWRRFVPADRILELGLEDNFWQMGETGPCGRCSEIYFLREGSSDAELEIWNNVFMEFDRDADGTLNPLPARSIDTGMGLERITSVLQDKPSNYDTDLFTPILRAMESRTGLRYGDDEESDISMRVVADHGRAMTFLIADGVTPSNEWRGYVLRKIMRRAMRHGRHLGLNEPFLHTLVAVLADHMGQAYPELRGHREMIEKTILAEESRFEAVLTEGLPRLEAEIARALETSDRLLAGDAAFRLYDTFGLPYDFIEDTAATQDVGIDREGYDRAMEAQRDKARAKSAFGGVREQWTIAGTSPLDPDVFEGYDATTTRGSQIVALADRDRHEVEALSEGQEGFVLLDRTPFYVEAGGQVSDIGAIETASARAEVLGVEKIRAGVPRAHRVRVVSGSLRPRDLATAVVDEERRNATRRNHTATHLLHAALRQVLGGHVKQAGSLVAPDRLRFDFVHFQPLSHEEIDRIEAIVNREVVRNVPVRTEVRSTDEAIASGAMALFGEKYGEKVRVVSVPGFSLELCGGTHVAATGDIGFFAIVAESGVAAGIRRIEALTGTGAVAWAQQQRDLVTAMLRTLQSPPEQAVQAIERLQADARRLAREISQLKTKMALGGPSQSESQDVVEVAGVRLARKRVAGLDKDALRALADSMRQSIKSGVVVLASEEDGKVQIVVAVTPDLTSRIKAGQIVKEIAPIVGGGGGGRPDFAEAGGKHPDKIDRMLEASATVVARLTG